MTYTRYLLAIGGLRAHAPTETITAENDARALTAASKIFSRQHDVDTIEIWEGERWVVNLGGRWSRFGG
jgi:hypothetical protein